MSRVSTARRAAAIAHARSQEMARSARTVGRQGGRPTALSPGGGVVRAYGVGGAHNAARRDRRATMDWTPRLGSPDGDTIPDLPALRARSRDAIRNAPIATGAVNTTVTAVVGAGLVAHPRIDRELLGLDEEAADEWERHAARYWRLWAESNMCDLGRRGDFGILTAQVMWSELADGDIFAVRRWVEAPGELFATRVQLVDADRVTNPNFGPDTDRLIGGIELDQYGAPLSAHVMNRHPGDVFFRPGSFSWDPVPFVGQSSGERQVLHIGASLRPGTTRSVPYLTPVLELLRSLEQYAGSEMMAALVSSFFTVFVKSSAVDENGDPMGLAAVDEEAALGVSAGQYKMGPAAILDLAPGEDIVLADPKRPNASFDPFTTAMLRFCGAALEMPYELLIKHFTASYSASRAAILEAWRKFGSRRIRLVRGFCNPCYDWVIAEAVMRGYLHAPGFFSDPLVRRAWTQAEWVGPTQGHIQPLQEANAARVRIDVGLTTLEEEIAAATGGEWEQKHRQQVKERRARRRDGLDVESVREGVVSETQSQTTTAVVEEPEDADELDEEEKDEDA